MMLGASSFLGLSFHVDMMIPENIHESNALFHYQSDRVESRDFGFTS